MSASSGLTIALAVARLVIALALLAYAFDWRSPLLASVRPWALAALIVLPVALILADVRALRSAAHPRGACTLNAIALGLAAASLACVLSLETDFHWTRRQVLGGDPAQLAKLGRHIMVGYRNADELHALIERRAIAGVFVAAHNVQGRSAAAIKREIAVLQEMRRQQGLPDLLIAADQEGGSVSRLSPPLAPLPPLASIVARYADPTERRRAVADYAAVHARELADLGINLNLAPVVDLTPQVVNGNDRLTRISSRAISGDPQIVTEVAETYCSQLLAHGVRCTLKHFPGLGRVLADTHLGPADLTTSPSELAAADWRPFRILMSQTDVAVMLSHARLTAMDPDHPVSFSRPVVGDLLRGEWGYDGVLMTDDFSMGAVYRSTEGIAGGSVAALNAGVDLVLISYDVDQLYVSMDALMRADRVGTLRADALQQSDRRLWRAFAR